jgi:hypothetical protein
MPGVNIFLQIYSVFKYRLRTPTAKYLTFTVTTAFFIALTFNVRLPGCSVDFTHPSPGKSMHLSYMNERCVFKPFLSLKKHLL